jgi:hypothetical protein
VNTNVKKEPMRGYKLIFLTFFLPIATTVYAQTLIVMGTSGKVFDQRTNAILVAGTKVSLSDSVYWQSGNSRIALIDASNKLYLFPGPGFQSKKTKNGFGALIREVLVPTTTTNMLAVRGAQMSSLEEIQKWFSFFNNAEKPLAIVGSLRIQLNPESFQNLERKYFFLRYTYNGEQINKRLPFVLANSTLYLLIDSSICLVDGKPVDPSLINLVELFYYDRAAAQSWSQGVFHIRYVSKKDLFEQWCNVKNIWEQNPNKTETLREICLNYLNSFYGQLDERKASELVDAFLGHPPCR